MQQQVEEATALINNDAIVFGLLMLILGLVFTTSKSENKMLKTFYHWVPALLLCYFLPSILTSLDIVDSNKSNVYYMASRYLLPAALVLLTLSIDFKAILGLGPKALIMFLTGTFGVMIGGPIAILVVAYFNPDLFGVEAWKGLSTVAGSWIGGGANQTAMKETFEVGEKLFSVMAIVDMLGVSVWMAIMLYLARKAPELDKKMGADISAIERIKQRAINIELQSARVLQLDELIKMIAIAFGCVALGHVLADLIGPWIGNNFPVLKNYSLHSTFFWLIVIVTTLGLSLSFTQVSKLEGAGASKIGSLFVYVLVTTIGLKMDIREIFRGDNWQYMLVGLVWLSIHAIILFTMAKLIKAPTFYVAVGSQANIGGAASAPVVAAAFHPSLAPVGVLLAVLGYAVGTYGAWICAQMMRLVSP